MLPQRPDTTILGVQPGSLVPVPGTALKMQVISPRWTRSHSRELGYGAFRWGNAVAWQIPLRAGMPIDQCVHDAGEAIRDIVQRLTGLRLGRAVGATDADEDLLDEDAAPDGV